LSNKARTYQQRPYAAKYLKKKYLAGEKKPAD